MNVPGFALERSQHGREQLAVMQVATKTGVPFKTFDDGGSTPDGWVPVGSIEFCSKALGRKLVPRYMPGFLEGHQSRRWWISDDLPSEDCFVKPADAYKRFNGCHVSSAMGETGPFFCSDRVTFTDEWRYYVADGRVVTTGWYMGHDEDRPAPALDVRWPDGWCGAVDMGLLPDGRLELVESQHPCACGWYGERHEDYVGWLVSGWRWLSSGKDLSTIISMAG